MSHLVDTDQVINYLNADQRAVALLDRLVGGNLGMSIITYGEIYDGIYHGDDPAAGEAAFLRLLRVIEVIDLNEEIMRRFGRIRGDLRDQGQRIGDSDVMIAATALHYDLILVTRNLRHFGRIPGLRLYEPS